jgi:hypothetical protein
MLPDVQEWWYQCYSMISQRSPRQDQLLTINIRTIQPREYSDTHPFHQWIGPGYRFHLIRERILPFKGISYTLPVTDSAPRNLKGKLVQIRYLASV